MLIGVTSTNQSRRHFDRVCKTDYVCVTLFASTLTGRTAAGCFSPLADVGAGGGVGGGAFAFALEPAIGGFSDAIAPVVARVFGSIGAFTMGAGVGAFTAGDAGADLSVPAASSVAYASNPVKTLTSVVVGRAL